MGGIRQQFCTPVTVRMVQYSVRFWKEFDERFAAEAGTAQAWFRQRGYLFLADRASATAVMRRFELEQRAGARVQLLSRDDIHALGWMDSEAYLALAKKSLRSKVVEPLRARGIDPVCRLPDGV